MRTLQHRIARLEERTGHADGVAAVVVADGIVTIHRWSGSKQSVLRSEFEQRYPDGRIDGQICKAYIATDGFDPYAA